MTYVVASLAISIILIVYVFTRNSDVYADKININICKLLNIQISNKVKRSGQTANPPKRSKH